MFIKIFIIYDFYLMKFEASLNSKNNVLYTLLFIQLIILHENLSFSEYFSFVTIICSKSYIKAKNKNTNHTKF